MLECFCKCKKHKRQISFEHKHHFSFHFCPFCYLWTLLSTQICRLIHLWWDRVPLKLMFHLQFWVLEPNTSGQINRYMKWGHHRNFGSGKCLVFVHICSLSFSLPLPIIFDAYTVQYTVQKTGARTRLSSSITQKSMPIVGPNRFVFSHILWWYCENFSRDFLLSVWGGSTVPP